MTERDIPKVINISLEYPELAWSETLFLKEIHNPNSISIVTEHENQIIAYLCARVVIDECHLQNLGVSQYYRGKGIGTALMGELINRLAPFNASRIFLELRKSNDAALRLYKKMGFQIVAIRKQYYCNPTEEGILMLKTIHEDIYCITSDTTPDAGMRP